MGQGGRSLIVGVRRRFGAGFKRQVVEELLAGRASLAQLSRRYELCPSVIRNWKGQYDQGQLADPEQVCQGQEQRIGELERLVGQLTLENALLKKAVAYTLRRRRENSSPITGPSSGRSSGGAE
jgi:transposase-like protein